MKYQKKKYMLPKAQKGNWQDLIGNPRDLAAQMTNKSDATRQIINDSVGKKIITLNGRTKKEKEQSTDEVNKSKMLKDLQKREKIKDIENSIYESNLYGDPAHSAVANKLRFFPEEPNNFFDEYLNPGSAIIGPMADALGHTIGNIQKNGLSLENIANLAGSVAAPLVGGAIGGIGAKTTGQFVNNMVNPFAGTGDLMKSLRGSIGTKQEFLDIITTLRNNRAKGLQLSKTEDELLNSVSRVGHLLNSGNVDESLSILQSLKNKSNNLSDRTFENLAGFKKSEIDDKIKKLSENNSKKQNIAEEGYQSGSYNPDHGNSINLQRFREAAQNIIARNLTQNDFDIPSRFYSHQIYNYPIKTKQSLLAKLRNKIDKTEKPTKMGVVKTLISNIKKKPDNNPLKEVLEAYNVVKSSPKGSSFIPAHSLSSDSYTRLSLPLIERGLRENIIDLNFHGFSNLNSLGFASRAGIDKELIVKQINSRLSKINQMTGKKYPFAKVHDSEIMYPNFTVTRKKYGGKVLPKAQIMGEFNPEQWGKDLWFPKIKLQNNNLNDEILPDDGSEEEMKSFIGPVQDNFTNGWSKILPDNQEEAGKGIRILPKEKQRNPFNPYALMRAGITGLTYFSEKNQRNQDDAYTNAQLTTLGQEDPIFPVQPSPYSLYAKYGGSLKKYYQKGGQLPKAQTMGNFDPGIKKYNDYVKKVRPFLKDKEGESLVEFMRPDRTSLKDEHGEFLTTDHNTCIDCGIGMFNKLSNLNIPRYLSNSMLVEDITSGKLPGFQRVSFPRDGDFAIASSPFYKNGTSIPGRPYDFKIATYDPEDNEYEFFGSSGSSHMNTTHFTKKELEEEIRNGRYYFYRPFAKERQSLIQAERSRGNESDRFYKERQKKVEFYKQSRNNPQYDYKISPSSPLYKKYMDNKLPILDNFINTANDPDFDKNMIDVLNETGYINEANPEDINNAKLMTFGELGQENKWRKAPVIGKGVSFRTGIENLIERGLPGFLKKNLSIGPGQIAFNTITEEERGQFGINRPKDLYDSKKVIPYMVYRNLQNLRTLRNKKEKLGQELNNESGDLGNLIEGDKRFNYLPSSLYRGKGALKSVKGKGVQFNNPDSYIYNILNNIDENLERTMQNPSSPDLPRDLYPVTVKSVIKK